MDKKTKPATNLVAMAEIAGVHGVKGLVKLKVFGDDPDALLDYPPLIDRDGKREFKILSLQLHGNIILAKLDGVPDRTAAEKLTGTTLYLPREALPEIETDSTYYHADLVGMTAQYPDKKIMGKIVAVSNFGAGDLLEIKPLKGASFYVPFTHAAVPHVDLAARIVTVDPPPGLLD